MSGSSFDRVRPRHLESQDAPPAVVDEVRVPDLEGKRALFSATPEPPSLGSVAVTCLTCDSRSVVTWASALKLAFPSVPALVPGAGVRLWLKCPTCRNRSWVEFSLRT